MRHFTLLITTLLALTFVSSALAQKKTKEIRSTIALELREGVVIEKLEKVSRPSEKNVCGGEKIAFQARVTGNPGKSQVRWQTSGGRGTTDAVGRFVVDTTDLAPGTYVVTADILDDANGCIAYDSKIFTVSPCQLIRTCFTPSILGLSTPAQTINVGETIKIYAGQIVGGENYGKLTAEWTSSEGKIIGDLESAKLDTTGVLPGSKIQVRFRITSEVPGCEANGDLTLKMADRPIPVPPVRLTPCDTFKFNNARVDNACKYVLQDVIKQLEADPQARLIIDSYYRNGENENVAILRGKNVRDRLADGSLGATIDVNR
ncbi:MAG TPA: Ig-like domain-containing protein, partial [Blastocatellia bacterium]|nr:Ig-like domain-containing protein [Blastocatellia bacterium]